MRNCVLYTLLALTPMTGGCGCIDWFAYVLTPPAPTKTVKAEFSGLSSKRLAILVDAGPETLLDHQTAQLETSDAVAAQLRKHVKGVTVVNPLRILRYQDENPRWYTFPAERLCRDFNADYAMVISLIEFSTRAPGFVHLARGRITAEASVYAASAGPDVAADRPVWRSQVIRIVYPKDSPLGVPANEDTDVRLETAKRYAQTLVKSFDDHKAPKAP